MSHPNISIQVEGHKVLNKQRTTVRIDGAVIDYKPLSVLNLSETEKSALEGMMRSVYLAGKEAKADEILQTLGAASSKHVKRAIVLD